MTCGNGKCVGSDCDCNKPSEWWGEEFGYNPNGYNQAPVIKQNWWNEQFSPKVLNVGVSAVEPMEVKIEKCVFDAYTMMQTNGDLQKLYNAGYNDVEIQGLLREECIKQLSKEENVSNDTDTAIVIVRTWVAVTAIAGTAILSGIIGYVAGRR